MTPLARDQKEQLLGIARVAIADAIGAEAQAVVGEGRWLDARAACFVTLKVDTVLHGCVGSLEAHRSLRDEVRSNAVAAALHDPRFPPLKPEQLSGTRIEISLLSLLSRVDAKTEAEALERVRPGKDGLVLRYGSRRGTLLPQVWEDVPDRREFFRHLKRKAGLDPNFWDPSIELYRYTVSHFAEGDIEDGASE